MCGIKSGTMLLYACNNYIVNFEEALKYIFRILAANKELKFLKQSSLCPEIVVKAPYSLNKWLMKNV